MDVKAINQTQAALSMHTANSQTHQQITLAQGFGQERREDDSFAKLHPQTQRSLLQQSIEQLNEKMKMFDNTLKIEFDEETGIQVVKIIDDESKEVIRQLPPEAVLKIARYIDEITGLLFEKRA